MKVISLQTLWIVLVLVMGASLVVSGQVELCSDNPPCVQDHGKSTEHHGEQDCPNGHVCGCGHSLVIEAPTHDAGFGIFQKSTTVYWDWAASSYEEPFREIDHPPQLA